jgi:hypothetical protein
LAALDGAVSSEALFNASPCFKDQVSIIVSAVLVTFYQAEFSVLEHEYVSFTLQFRDLTVMLAEPL